MPCDVTDAGVEHGPVVHRRHRPRENSYRNPNLEDKVLGPDKPRKDSRRIQNDNNKVTHPRKPSESSQESKPEAPTKSKIPHRSTSPNKQQSKKSTPNSVDKEHLDYARQEFRRQASQNGSTSFICSNGGKINVSEAHWSTQSSKRKPSDDSELTGTGHENRAEKSSEGSKEKHSENHTPRNISKGDYNEARKEFVRQASQKGSVSDTYYEESQNDHDLFVPYEPRKLTRNGGLRATTNQIPDAIDKAYLNESRKAFQRSASTKGGVSTMYSDEVF